jgi:hypothetical protein
MARTKPFHYTVILPNGKKASLKNSPRNYSHALAVRTEGHYYHEDGWVVLGYSASERLAANSINRYRNIPGYAEFAILPVKRTGGPGRVA